MDSQIMNAGMLAVYAQEPEKNIDQVTIQTAPFGVFSRFFLLMRLNS
jgi:hypothetical protein